MWPILFTFWSFMSLSMSIDIEVHGGCSASSSGDGTYDVQRRKKNLVGEVSFPRYL